MFYVIVVSVLCGALVTLLLQLLLLYRRSPEPIARTVQYVKASPDPALKDYLHNQHVDLGQQPDSATPASSKQQEAVSPRQQEAAAPSSSPKQPPPSHSEPPHIPKPETCNFLNAIFLFLFRELRDTPVVRHWVIKKIKVEFEELLQTKTAGRLLEGLSLRDISLGNSLPVFKTAKLMTPVEVDEDGMPDELNFEVDLEYNGGFHLAIDVDLVFGKSAYLFVKMTRVAGRLKLQFTRMPFTHWSFSFLEEPLIDFEVKSQFEGRPLPQLTSIIVNQLKRVIKKKHTLPNYKIRYKPFFPFQVQPPLAAACDLDLSVHDNHLVEGRLRVTLVECSRLFILGSYDRETYVHCTLELSSEEWKEKTRSSIKTTEVIKGSSQSVGMTFRHVPATEGDVVHVSIETVTPNSPAALADLQKGDRLIAIGGVKVTSSVQVPKLLKQAGDKVQVVYERPVRHQIPPMGALQEGFSQLEEPSFLPQPMYEEDPAPITTLDTSDSKDMDSEFEELIMDPKPIISDIKDDLLTVNQSPKRTVANLATKPLGTISPILNRKLNLSGLQLPLKPQTKETLKSLPPKSSELPEGPQRPAVPPPPPPSRPPVPPRSHIKLASTSSDTQSMQDGGDVPSEKPERPIPPANNGDKQPANEKVAVKLPDQKPAVRQMETSEDPAADYISRRQDAAKDKVSEASTSTKDSLEDHFTWESSETLLRNQSAKWAKASVVFDVESNHKYLNVALWCKDPFKLGSLLCLGHVSLKLEHIALECLSTSSLEFQSSFRLCPPEPRASVSRTALRNLSTHKGFNEKLCYGDVTLNFTYLSDSESEFSSSLVEFERENIQQEDEPCQQQQQQQQQQPVLPREDHGFGSMQIAEFKHNFQDTQFQNPTWCEYCKKKVWTKAASQCMICAYVCHKKCQEKCLSEHPFCMAADRRGADSEAKSTINRATTGLTRHILNTSSRLLSLRQVPKTRLAEQVADPTVEPSPKQTPNTSDNESSDTETYVGASPSKKATSTSGSTTKLARKEGGLDDSVFIAVKEIGRDLYRGLPTDERSQKLEFMLDKLQQEIDQELEHNNSLLLEERETADPRKKALTSAALAKSGERLQALTLLTIHYRAGIEDLESVESTSPSEHQGFKAKCGSEDTLEGAEDFDTDTCNPLDVPLLDDITEEQICVEALP
ncbi:PDZ domain-containing protein 8 [Brienomyrus brachyistius]|uniref:PDZ domain-containing protein 8 n=1 Tax=Brienomyrus brachyistius TaxID=42636 RepID=UPI0020B374F8|nr:PDZ domain-containing protein 8 [Brienomyrus brachyistius]